MAKVESGPRCDNCGTEVNPRSDTAYRRAFDGRGHVTRWACGERCALALRVKRLEQRHCAQCRQLIERDNGGRPAAFCSEPCRRQRERDLQRAVKALARGTVPDRPAGFGGARTWRDRLDTELADAELLLAHWSGRGPTPPLGEHSPDARAALVQRVTVLRRLRHNADLEVAEEDRRTLLEQRAQRAREIAEEEARRDNAWRDELLASKENLA